MTATEAKERIGELIDYYFDKVAEAKTPKDIYSLNWYCAQRMTEMSWSIFTSAVTPDDADK